jgi:hypothetical protein
VEGRGTVVSGAFHALSWDIRSWFVGVGFFLGRNP